MATTRTKNGVITVRYYTDGSRHEKSFNRQDFYHTRKNKDGEMLKNSDEQAQKEAQKAADKFLKEIEAKITLGQAFDESNITFSKYSEQVFKMRDKNAKKATKELRTLFLKQLNAEIGKVKIKDLTPMRIKKLFLELSETKSDNALIKIKGILNIVFDSAVEDGLIEINPFLRMKLSFSRKNQKEKEIVPADKFKEFVSYISSDVNKKYIDLSRLESLTGMRPGEASAILESDFDFDKNTFIINKAYDRYGNLGDPKKHKHRSGIITEPLAELVYERKEVNNRNRRLLGSEYRENNLLICHEDGSPMKYDAVKSFFQRAEKKTGIKIRPYQFRHTFATNLDGELSVKDIQQLLGHADARTTLNIYTHHTGFSDAAREKISGKTKSYLK